MDEEGPRTMNFHESAPSQYGIGKDPNTSREQPSNGRMIAGSRVHDSRAKYKMLQDGN